MASFNNKKELKFIVTLGESTFANSDKNQIIMQGFRASVDINKAGGAMMSTLNARIFGVSQADMNSVTTLTWRPETRIKNTVQVFAIDGDIESLVFAGNIVNAWGDYQSIPDVFLSIQAQAAYFNGLQAVRPLSIKGGVNVAIVMERIAKDMGLVFENNNVSVILTDVYVANTLKEQAVALASAANCALYIDDKILAITNKYAPRKGVIPNISPQSGLIGYPTFDGIGVNFQSFFNPAVTFGGSIKLTTDITQAAGEWIVVSMAHQLESEKPNGVWKSTIRGNRNGLAVVSR